jgi:hypothetical protein
MLVMTVGGTVAVVIGWEPNPEGGSVFFLDLPSEPEGSG